MAKRKKKVLPPPLICICCTQLVLEKFDKYNRPYVTCPSCGMRYFFKNDMAKEGYRLTSELICSVLQAHTEELQRRYQEAVYQQQLQRDRDEKAKRRKAKEKAKAAKKD